MEHALNEYAFLPMLPEPDIDGQEEDCENDAQTGYGTQNDVYGQVHPVQPLLPLRSVTWLAWTYEKREASKLEGDMTDCIFR